MKSLKTTNNFPVMRAEKDDIEIVYTSGKSISIWNKKNKSYFFCSYANQDFEKEIIYRDRNMNILCTNGFSFSYQGNTYEIEEEGDSVNVSDGTIACRLKYDFMKELLNDSFYEKGQYIMYDFIKEKILIPLR